jgi:hypothetical protein
LPRWSISALLNSIGPLVASTLIPADNRPNRSNRITAPGVRSYKKLLKWAQGRVFFTTKNGYMGLGVAGTRTGNIVAILRSGRTPFILRKTRDQSIFTLLGEAYVHGLMNGEAVRSGKPWETLYLS